MTNLIEQQASYIYDDIITDEQKDQAIEDIKGSDAEAWNSARLAVELIDALEGELRVSSVYKAVALLYHKADSTIKRRCVVARRISPEMVCTNPRLSFSYWKVVADASHLDDKAQAMGEVVVWIEDHLEAYGKLPSVRTVEGWVYGDDDVTRPVWRLYSDSVTDKMELIYYDERTPDDYRALIGWARGMILYYLETGISPMTGDQSDLLTATTREEATSQITS